eukprot:TRINITY_DN16538_c0_g1_i1.p1 TRINITY_DN16538_c0_g1~~TRINITY_DN16538_c0_g1_i1.p1  ORF type:complete len:357 (-),score=57.08 TRINITY_DN16538_c0_g1_i1:143-1213(-)
MAENLPLIYGEVHRQERIARSISKALETHKRHNPLVGKSNVRGSRLLSLAECTIEGRMQRKALKSSMDYKRSLSYNSLCNRSKKRASIDPRQVPSLNKILPISKIAINLIDYSTRRRANELGNKKESQKLKVIPILQTKKSEDSILNRSLELSNDTQFAKMTNFVIQLNKLPNMSSLTTISGSTTKLKPLNVESKGYKRVQLIRLGKEKDSGKSSLASMVPLDAVRQWPKNLTKQPSAEGSPKLSLAEHRNSHVGSKKTLVKFINRRSSFKNEVYSKKVTNNFCSVRNLLSIISRKFGTNAKPPKCDPGELRKVFHIQSYEHMELVPKLKMEWPPGEVKFTISEGAFYFPNDFLMI